MLIVRHAEKPADGKGLTPAGEARAKRYVSYFSHFEVNGRPLHLTHIFATADSKKSERPRLTVTPLSKALHLPIDNRFKDKQYADLARDLQSHSYGKEILICWHHGKIPALLDALGASASLILHSKKWPDNTYNWMVEMRFDGQGHVKQSTLVKENF